VLIAVSDRIFYLQEKKDMMEGTYGVSIDKVPFDSALEGVITPYTGISALNLI